MDVILCYVIYAYEQRTMQNEYIVFKIFFPVNADKIFISYIFLKKKENI